MQHQGAQVQNHHHSTQEHVVQKIADPQPTSEKIERRTRKWAVCGTFEHLLNHMLNTSKSNEGNDPWLGVGDPLQHAQRWGGPACNAMDVKQCKQLDPEFGGLRLVVLFLSGQPDTAVTKKLTAVVSQCSSGQVGDLTAKCVHARNTW